MGPKVHGLKDSGYELDETNGLWKRSGFSSTAYSDGEEVEQVLLQIVTEAEDLSSSSDELQSHCTDWVTSYHLSKQRANLLRPFEEQLSGSILEVGAGCGAISRYLGEVAESVVAVEGSIRRAQILKQRTRDLDNVQVIADNFETFDLNQHFDVVVVVGVLEYADMFLRSDNPFVDFLKKLRKLVTDDGFMLLAIENKLGLKYFAGANEDHLGAPMIGIEGRYQDGGPRTFSRKELQVKMLEARFSSQFFHSPVPDYKLPVGVITERGILDEDFSSAALSGEASVLDLQLPLDSHFNPLLAWHEIGRTPLEIDVSNSFLVEARPLKVKESITAGLLAEHYGSVRRRPFQKTKRFTRKDGTVSVVSFPTFPTDSLENFVGFAQNFAPEKYLSGRTMRLDIVKRLVSAQSPAEVLLTWIAEWLEILASHAYSCGFGWPATIRPGAIVDGRLLDAIPRNVVVTADGPIFFDQEWTKSENLSIEQLVFRSILDVYGVMPMDWQRRWDLQEIMDIVSHSLGLSPSPLQEQFSVEMRFQHFATFQSLPRSASLHLELTSERDVAVSERDVAVSERDVAVSELYALQLRLETIETTRSWRWTKIFRRLFSR